MSMRRLLLLSVWIMGVIALGAAALLLAGPRPPEAQWNATPDETTQAATSERAGDPPDKGPHLMTEREALVADAQTYADDMGVSLEEAIRRLEMQDDPLPSRLDSELRRNEPDTFAGLWMRHKPDYGITVATAGEPEAMMEKVEPYVEGTQWEGTVRIKRFEATEAELKAARAEAERMLDRLGIRYSSGDNLFRNRMEIYVRDEAQVQHKLRAAGLELPEHVVVIESSVGPG